MTMYVKKTLRYKIRLEIMDDETPEVWIELAGQGHHPEPILVGGFYREQTEVRGKASNPGSDRQEEHSG